MVKITRVARLTGPQLAEGLEKLPPARLAGVQQKLVAESKNTAADEVFLAGVNARLKKDGLFAKNASSADLKRALSLELAKLERTIATTDVRRAGETVSLVTVEKSFGKTMRGLLEALEEVHVPGRLDEKGRVPLTSELADEVKVLYGRLGLDATDDKIVHEMQKVYPTFDDVTLDGLHRKFHAELPDRRELRSTQALAELEKEAQAVAEVIEKHGTRTQRDVVFVMQGLGYEGFDPARLQYLRKKFPDLVPSLSRQHTPEQYEATAAKIRTFIEKHPAATARVIARAFSLPLAFVVEAAELAGIALTETRTSRILDPYDPLCDGFVRFALASRPKHVGDEVHHAVLMLNSSAAFVERFGQVTEQKLAKYVDEYLPRLRPAHGNAPWKGIEAGVHDRKFAELAAFFYSVPDIDEPTAFAAIRSFDPSFTKYRLTQLRAEHPDLPLSFRVTDADERRQMARTVGRLMEENPGVPMKDIADLAWQAGLPRFDESRISNLRAEFPDLIPKLVDRASNARLAEIREGARQALEQNPRASVAEVAAAVGARENQVVKPLRDIRKEAVDVAQSRFSDVDRALIERVVRGAEPGDTLGDIQAKLMKDKTFRARHESVSVNTIRDTIIALVPEAADWKVYNITIVARVLDDALQKAPPDKSLSRIVDSIRKEYPGFPRYVALLSTGVRSMEKHIERVPWMKKYLDDSGRLKLSTGGPSAELTMDLAKVLAKAFVNAPPDWKNDQIFEELHKDPQIKARYPVLTESTLTGLRRKFPGVIPVRTGGMRQGFDAAADAKKLSMEMQAIVDKGGKIELESIAKQWGVDPQYFRRIMRKNPSLFPMYKKRYEITEHVARTMGAVIATMPMGVTLEQAAVLLDKSGLFPSDMKLGKTILINAQAKFPALVPNLNERNQQMFLRLVCRDLFTAPTGTPVQKIFDDARQKTGQLPVSSERFLKEIVPAWQTMKPAERPEWVKAILVDGKVPSAGLGKPKAAFPKQDLAAVEQTLAQLAEVPPRLEMLERIVARKARNAFADWNILNIQHLLGSNFRFVEATNRLGASKEDIVTVGIPYSTSDTIARTMNEGGLETLTPPLNIAAWERQVEDAVFQMVEKSKKNGKKVVVFDDGGLVAKILHEKPWAAEHKHLFRIVEQTTRGITVAKKYDLDVPLVNYAQDPAKNLEGNMIGEVVLDRIYKRLDGIGKRKALKGMPVTAVGAGVIGLPTALDLARAGAKVTIYDLDPEARKRAREAAKKEGLDIQVVDDPKAAFSGARMIVGSTGHTSIAQEAFEHMADGCILVSTSSKLVEIDMELLDRKATDGSDSLRREVIDKNVHPPTCTYELDDGRKITVLADGFPVNFDGAVNCVDPEDIQLTHAGMLLAGIQATWKNLENGLLPFDDKLRAELLKDWEEVKAARPAKP